MSISISYEVMEFIDVYNIDHNFLFPGVSLLGDVFGRLVGITKNCPFPAFSPNKNERGIP